MNLPRVAAAVLVALGLAELAGRPIHGLLPGIVLVVCATVPVAFARTRLLPAGAVVTAANLLALVLGGRPTIAALLAQAAVLYLAGAHSARRHRRRQATRAAYADLAHDHAAREERARIARELHDIVAHHISAISVQAEVARLTTPDLSPAAAARLLAIGETARLALTEMRRLLGVLREDAVREDAAHKTGREDAVREDARDDAVHKTGHEDAVREDARENTRDDAGQDLEHAPQPGLGELLTLVDRARLAGGGHIRLIVCGRTRPLDPGVELTAYRIVQEALTNTRKHAPGAAMDIELSYVDDLLRLNIRDTGGRARHAGGSGLGLLGMRERVTMAGGTLRTGHSRAGGFVVQAALPVASAGSTTGAKS